MHTLYQPLALLSSPQPWPSAVLLRRPALRPLLPKCKFDHKDKCCSNVEEDCAQHGCHLNAMMSARQSKTPMTDDVEFFFCLSFQFRFCFVFVISVCVSWVSRCMPMAWVWIWWFRVYVYARAHNIHIAIHTRVHTRNHLSACQSHQNSNWQICFPPKIENPENPQTMTSSLKS